MFLSLSHQLLFGRSMLETNAYWFLYLLIWMWWFLKILNVRNLYVEQEEFYYGKRKVKATLYPNEASRKSSTIGLAMHSAFFINRWFSKSHFEQSRTLWFVGENRLKGIIVGLCQTIKFFGWSHIWIVLSHLKHKLLSNFEIQNGN